MACNKTGFTYYSVETNRYQDIRIKKLKKAFKCEGISVYDYILCEIYRVKGCYLDWDESTLFDVADYFGIDETLVTDIVNYCCFVGLFSERLLSQKSVLTSRSIQNRYLDWSKKAKRLNPEIPEKIEILPEASNIIPEECQETPEDFDKVKKSKVKKSKVTETPVGEVDVIRLIYPFESQEFVKEWERWKIFKKKQHNFTYKSEDSEQAALNTLKRTAHGNEQTALAIIEQAIANGWKGLFELKNAQNWNTNEQTNTNRSGNRKISADEAREKFVNG